MKFRTVQKLIDTSIIVLALSVIGSSLAGCGDTPEETAKRIQIQQQRLERADRYENMKVNRKAIFEEEASYGDNCVVGAMHWVNNDGNESYSRAVICKALPTVSLQYPTGKTQTTNLIVGETAEQIAAKIEAEAKKKALDKLTPEEKKLLDLK